MNHRSEALLSLFVYVNVICNVTAWGSNIGAQSGTEGPKPFVTKRSTFVKGLLLGSVVAPSAAVAFDGGVGAFYKRKLTILGSVLAGDG